MRRFESTLAAALVLACTASVSVAQNNSEQVIFSGLAQPTSTSATKIAGSGSGSWCEADSNNPYDGKCNGAMYVYALAITEHVSGTITESATTEHQYTMNVSSKSLACTLTNSVPVQKGQNNAVTVMCAIASKVPTTLDAVSLTAVVNVTALDARFRTLVNLAGR